MTTIETPLIVAEKRALEEELHALKMSFYDRREADAEIESFKQTIKQLEEKLEQLRNECQELYKQKHEYAEEQISRMLHELDKAMHLPLSAVRNELSAQLESYEHKLSASSKLADEFKREHAKSVSHPFGAPCQLAFIPFRPTSVTYSAARSSL